MNRKSKIIALTLFLLVVLGFGLYYFNSSSSTKNPPKADQNHAPSFYGTEAFIDSGLTTNQVNGLIKALEKYAPRSNNINIDTNSLTPGPHDPDKVSPFTINFKIAIDSVTYNGKIVYSGLKDIHLYLYSPASGRQIYDSGVVISV